MLAERPDRPVILNHCFIVFEVHADRVGICEKNFPIRSNCLICLFLSIFHKIFLKIFNIILN